MSKLTELSRITAVVVSDYADSGGKIIFTDKLKKVWVYIYIYVYIYEACIRKFDLSEVFRLICICQSE